MNDVRKFFLDNIATVIEVFDQHDPGIQEDGRYRCPKPCEWIGVEPVWRAHLAEAIAEAINERVVQLPLMGVPA